MLTALCAYWSRCKLGRERVYWVVQVFGDWDNVVAEGYSRTVEEAEAEAKAIAGPDSRQWQAHIASKHHRLKVHERRKARTKGPGGAEVRRFVYAQERSEYDGREYWLAYPVLKVTAKRIFIGRAYHVVGNEDFLLESPDPLQECASLDRAKFESEGRIYHHRWREVFYLDLPSPSRMAPSPMIEQALSVLGLTWPASPEDIRVAYRRRAFEAHPDTGGSEEEFRRVHEAYDLCAKR